MSLELGEQWKQAMLAGDFERAWKVSDLVRARGEADPHRFWQGETLAGKRVMLRSLHGIGDAIQFLAYLPRLKAVARSVCLQVAPPLVELAQCLAGVGEVITWGPEAQMPEPEWDVQVEVMELPYLFRTQLAELPIATRYLNMPVVLKGNDDKALQVGLMWTAGDWNAERSISFERMRSLLQVEDTAFWNLERHAVPSGTGLRDDGRTRECLPGLAERVAQLDLVITVDTVTAHLAGAMGVPAWVLLQRDADWRWMRGREDSPWYPSLRLFRQAHEGRWDEPLASVTSELKKLAKAKVERK